MSSPPTMGIGTSSSSSGASAPRANAYAVNRDASELRRSPARKAPASAQPGPMHVFYMSVDTATQGPTALQGDTRRDKKETARIAENSQLSGRFRRWWQVLGSNQRRLSRRFYRPPQLRSVYGLWPAVTLPGSIDGDVASHVCPTQRGFGLRSWTVSLGIGAFRGSHVP